MSNLPDSQRLELLKLLKAKPQMSQRELASAMGVSLGKVNYCLLALVDQGFIKLEKFRQNPDKRHYAYLLTKTGVKEKRRITLSFLRRKVVEYKLLQEEIEKLRNDLKKTERDSRCG